MTNHICGKCHDACESNWDRVTWDARKEVWVHYCEKCQEEIFPLRCGFCHGVIGTDVYRVLSYQNTGDFEYACKTCGRTYQQHFGTLVSALIVDAGGVIKHEWSNENVCSVCEGLMCDVCPVNNLNRRGILVHN